MNIAKALKVKNRLAGEVTRLQELFRRENSRRSDNLSTVDVGQVEKDLLSTVGNLIRLKAALCTASAPIGNKLAELAESKTLLTFYLALPTREGEEQAFAGPTRDVIKFQWTAFHNRAAVDKAGVELQQKINDLQDEIDDYNARTKVEYTDTI